MTYHYMTPEKQWGCFDERGYFCAMFDTAAEASDYCARHNAR
jgi:hypothetical protein